MTAPERSAGELRPAPSERASVAAGASPGHAVRTARALWDRLGVPVQAHGSAALAPLRSALAQARRQSGPLAVIHLARRPTSATTDGSQTVRDMLSLLSCTRSTDLVLRLGDGEVAVVLTELGPSADVEGIALRLRQGLRAGVHAGVARFPQDGQTAAELLHHVAWALFVAGEAQPE